MRSFKLARCRSGRRRPSLRMSFTVTGGCANTLNRTRSMLVSTSSITPVTAISFINVWDYSQMEKRKAIYEGKAKILYETDDPDLLIQYFKDDATAFNAQKKGTIHSKGIMNNKISTKIFEFLASEGIP